MKTDIQTVVSGWILVMDVADSIKTVYNTVANVMDAVEKQNTIKDGKSKKEWVLAFVKAMFFETLKDWDYWVNLISAFIDKAKTLYNFVKQL